MSEVAIVRSHRHPVARAGGNPPLRHVKTPTEAFLNATPTPTPTATDVAPVGSYPVATTVPATANIPRWQPTFAGLVLIPQWIMLFLYAIGAAFYQTVAFIVVLFTGTYPEGAYRFLTRFHGWLARFMAYYLWLTDKRPGLGLDEEPGDVVHYQPPPYPGKIERWRVFQYILGYPYIIFVSLIGIVAWIGQIIRWFTITLTGKEHEGMREWSRKWLVLNQRSLAYQSYYATQYPPFDTNV